MASYWKPAAIGVIVLFICGVLAGPASDFFILGALACILSALAAFPLSSLVPTLRTKHAFVTILALVCAGVMTGTGAALAMPLLWAGGFFITLSMVFASVFYDVRKDHQPPNSRS